MKHLSSQAIFNAFDHALEVSSRWPQLFLALDLDARNGKPGPRAFNDALQAKGFRPVVDETEVLQTLLKDYPDAWWFAIAEETAGHREATVQQVVAALNARTSVHAAQ